ncbi:AAA family ATPase [Hazenella coriacea]|uniref:MoxR-like ATPase n=1 Tax=Hazenella coriacea TaxID=1179467 RepID=A0A4R3L597_9BACL|nr:MoxR family ATPase [Hazenella coriacea]TCS93314.1 MoxR-like ATPase [Hazenella coriacea]
MSQRNHFRSEWDQEHPKVQQLINHVEKVIIGKRSVIQLCVAALLSRGHVLLEDVPGVGKTVLVKALAKSLGAPFSRIQFTPDLMPSDVTGVSIFNQKTLNFEFRPGPLMANIVLADEINRTSPKTQSALLEALEEGSITVDGHTYPLDIPFFVMATQNPIEYEGTYPLPEAQLDRFLLKLHIGYPSADQEVEMLKRFQDRHPLTEIEQILTKEELQQFQEEIPKVHVDDSIARYIVHIIEQTRKSPYLYLGASPRASLALYRVTKTWAFMHQRQYVIPDDVKYLAPFVLAHRVILNSDARLKGHSAETIINRCLEQVKVPVKASKEGRISR